MKIKKLLYASMITLMITSCTMNGDTPPGEHTFPLTKSFTVDIGEEIREIALTNTWVAVLTPKSIVAIDSATHRELWRKELQALNDLGGFVVIENKLLYLS